MTRGSLISSDQGESNQLLQFYAQDVHSGVLVKVRSMKITLHLGAKLHYIYIFFDLHNLSGPPLLYGTCSDKQNYQHSLIWNESH